MSKMIVEIISWVLMSCWRHKNVTGHTFTQTHTARAPLRIYQELRMGQSNSKWMFWHVSWSSLLVITVLFCSFCICVFKRTTNHLPLVLLLLLGSLVARFDPFLAPLPCTCWRLVVEQFVFLPLFHFFCSLFFAPNFNFYLFSCTCLRQLAQEPHLSVRRQFSQTLHLANISDQSCQLTFEIANKTKQNLYIEIANMLQRHFSSVLSSEPKRQNKH